jgi:Leucine-rich repeat (LRR) protein
MISNISPLSNLTELSYLNLSGNIIVDISPLYDLKNLYHLDLSYNLISDISVLSNLINLSYLNISVNKISNIYYLENLHATIDALSQTIDLGILNPQFDDTFMLELDFLKDLHGFIPCIDFISNNGSCYEGESCDCSTIVWEDITITTNAYFNFSDDEIFSGVVNVTLVPNPL